MDVIRIGRLLRMMRLRRGWRLRDLSARCGLSTSALGRHELGAIGSLGALGRHASALDLRLDLRLVGRGVETMRIADEEHAAIVNRLLSTCLANQWPAQAEVSFSEWGERGRMDLMARDPMQNRLIVVEVKTELGDLQDLLGALDVKRRLAPAVGRRLGWVPGEVAVVLAVASTERNRAIVATHRALFSAFDARTYRGGAMPHGQRELLWVPAHAVGRQHWLAGRRQVRA